MSQGLILAGFWLLVGGLLAWRRFRSLGKLAREDRLLASAVVFGAFALVLLMVGAVGAQFNLPFNSWRLSSTFALANGIPLYDPSSEAPLLGWMYGPVGVLYFLPALVASRPTWAIAIASTLSALAFFLPVLLVHLRGNTKNKRNRDVAVAAFLAFVAFSFSSASLSYAAFLAHVDGLALGLCTLALLLLSKYSGKESWALALSVLCVSLAVWTKQNTFLMVLALPLCLFITSRKWSDTGRVFSYLILFGGTVSAIFVVAFGPEALFFNWYEMPSRLPWQFAVNAEGQPTSSLSLNLVLGKGLFPALEALLKDTWFAWIVLGTVFLIGLKNRQKNPTLSVWFFVTGILMLPLSLIGKCKWGGVENSLAPTLYFLAGATTLWLASSPNRVVSPQLVKWGLSLFLFLVPLQHGKLIYYYFKVVPRMPVSHEDIAHHVMRKNPGTVSFPNNPLASLMAEKRLSPVNWAISQRKLANYPFTEDQLRKRYQTDRPQIVPAGRNPTGTGILNFRPSVSRNVTSEFPGWEVFEIQ